MKSNYELTKTEQELRALQPKVNTLNLPMVTYDGKIHYLSDFYDIAEAFENLTKKVSAVEGDEMVGVAFDMEWTFNYQTGPEKTSLIQVCLELDECFLFHLPQLKKLPASMSAFLCHPRVRLHGVNIKNDLRKLERDFPIIKADPMIENCCDLGVWYNEVLLERPLVDGAFGAAKLAPTNRQVAASPHEQVAHLLVEQHTEEVRGNRRLRE